MAHNLTEADCEVDASEKKKKKNQSLVGIDSKYERMIIHQRHLCGLFLSPPCLQLHGDTGRPDAKKQNTLSVFPRHRGGKRTDSVPFTQRVAAAAASDAVRPQKEQTLCVFGFFFQLAREPWYGCASDPVSLIVSVPLPRTQWHPRYCAIFGIQGKHSITVGALEDRVSTGREESNEHQPTPCPPPHRRPMGLPGGKAGLYCNVRKKNNNKKKQLMT